MHLLFLFLDGVGLGSDDPLTNPFARASMPNLQNLLGGNRLLMNALQETYEVRPAPRLRDQAIPIHPPLHLETQRASLLGLDACLGVSGLPQSASGQATLLTGQNVPAALGYHYGPKPNPAVAAYLRNGNLFNMLKESGRKAGFLNAYPPRYFAAIQSGLRLYSAIPLAATSAGMALHTSTDLLAGRAIAADFTAQGWHTHLGLTDTPLLSPEEAGVRLAELARKYHFSMFEYWMSDYAGHNQKMEEACALLESFDQVLGGLLDAWNDHEGLILLTSDHGNLEDLSTRRHTYNLVPALLIGALDLRRRWIQFAQQSASHRKNEMQPRTDKISPLETQLDLSDVAPAIIHFLDIY
jgi:2,3-bisphosphoglycerate-independent phosphoglycerate mutase